MQIRILKAWSSDSCYSVSNTRSERCLQFSSSAFFEMAFLVLKVSQLRILTTASFLAVAGMICILFRIWEVCIPNGTCCAQDHPAGFPSITDTSDHNDRGGLKQLGPHTGLSEYTDSPHCKIQHFFQVFILNSSSVGDRY